MLPLSEHEQRILQDIERSFYESDPKFVKAVDSDVFLRQAQRNFRLSIVGFVIGLVVLLLTFTSVPVAALGGFILMVVSTARFVSSFKRMGLLALRGNSESTTSGSSTAGNAIAQIWHKRAHRDRD